MTDKERIQQLELMIRELIEDYGFFTGEVLDAKDTQMETIAKAMGMVDYTSSKQA